MRHRLLIRWLYGLTGAGVIAGGLIVALLPWRAAEPPLAIKIIVCLMGLTMIVGGVCIVRIGYCIPSATNRSTMTS